jgi:TetR/AcrR family transcriptional repressor of nem operon
MSATISRHTQTDTRKLILRMASELLLTRSYLGLNFQDLADRVGIRKASLYHHFESKDALGLALVSTIQAQFIRWTEEVAELSPGEQLLGYVRMYRDLIGAGGKVCAVGAFGGEWDCIESELKAAVRGFHKTQTDWLTQVAAKLPAHPLMANTPWANWSAEQMAAQVNTLCQGAMLNARIHDDVTVFDLAVAPLRSQLQSFR